MSVSFPLPSSPHCDPRMIVLMVVGFAGCTHAMPVESEGNKAQKTRGACRARTLLRAAHAWHVPGLPPDPIVGPLGGGAGAGDPSMRTRVPAGMLYVCLQTNLTTRQCLFGPRGTVRCYISNVFVGHFTVEAPICASLKH